MAQRRFGIECERCRDKFRTGEEVYLAQCKVNPDKPHRFTTFLLCRQCAEDHVQDYIFLAYLVFVGGVSR